jgi:fibronectin type 3 domain-containing protein
LVYRRHDDSDHAQSYAYRVIAINAAGESAPSSTIAAATRPLAPAGVTATTASSTQIDVTWSASVGANSYRIERSANGGASWSIAGTAAALTFSDVGLAASTTYSYRVTAVGAGGDSLVSATDRRIRRRASRRLSSRRPKSI